jgi:hypothetical protein
LEKGTIRQFMENILLFLHLFHEHSACIIIHSKRINMQKRERKMKNQEESKKEIQIAKRQKKEGFAIQFC